MALYQGKVKTRSNTVKRVEIQARNEEEAKATIGRMGRVVTFKRKFSINTSTKMSAGDRQIFYSRLSAMLASKVGTSDALLLMRDTFSGKIQEISGRLLSYVETGDDLSSAFEKIGSPDFPEATVALIKAGARTGESGKALRDAAEFEYQLHNIKKNASKGLMSGVGSFLIAGLLTIGSTLYVGPAIMDSPLIKGANVNIDWINNFAYWTGVLMAVLMIFAIGMWFLATVARQIAPVKVDQLILKIPFYKDLVLSRNNFVVLYGLSLLIKSGVRMEEALRLSAEGAPRGALKNDLIKATAAVKNGKPWPKMMDTLHPTDKAALMSAPDREQIANSLDVLSTTYRELYGQRIASFVPIVNLLAALFLSIAGGLLFGQSILPMLMAAQNMTG